MRFQPFLIGILVAYLLYRIKEKDFKIPHVLNVLMWQMSMLAMFAVVFGPASRMREDNLNTHTWTPFESVVYNCFHKTVWSLALGWIVFSCHKGYGGLLNDFLSWEGWVPLSKLTYGAYLNHITIQSLVMYSITSPMYLTDFVLVSSLLTRIIYTCLKSFFFSHGFLWAPHASYLELHLFNVCLWKFLL